MFTLRTLKNLAQLQKFSSNKGPFIGNLIKQRNSSIWTFQQYLFSEQPQKKSNSSRSKSDNKTDLKSLDVEAEGGYSKRGLKELEKEAKEAFKVLKKPDPGQKFESYKKEGISADEAIEKYKTDIERDDSEVEAKATSKESSDKASTDKSSFEKASMDTSREKTSSPTQKITELNSEAEWQTLLKGNRPIILDFYLEGCGVCNRLYPKLANKAKRSKEDWTLVKVNMAKMKDFSKKMQVQNAPTVVLVHEGEIKDYFEGAPSDRNLDTFFGKADTMARK